MLDQVAQIAKIILIFISFTLVMEIHIVLRDYVSNPPKYQRIIRYYLFVLAVVFTGLTIYFSSPTPPPLLTPGEFYIFQVDSIIYVITFLFYMPVAIFIFFRKLFYLLSLTNKVVYYKLVFFTLLAIFLIGERGYNLGGYSLVQSVLGLPIKFSLVVDFGALMVISVMFLFLVIRYPDLMESISTFFSVKRLYLLKNNGILLFEYDFEEKKISDGVESDATLIGGFVYAVSEGFKEVLQSDDDINEFTSGNRSVLIQHGNTILGVLIVTEESTLLQKKIVQLIKTFETHYKAELEHWTGEFSLFDPKLVEKWIFKHLTEV